MMGDMADFVNEYLYEAYDCGILDELGIEQYPSMAKTKTCRCCGKTGLTWGQSIGRWRLFDGHQLHDCPVNKLK